MSSFTRISVTDAQALISSQSVSIVDIRDEDSYRLSHIRNAQHLDNALIRIGQELAVRFDGDVAGDNVEYVVTIGDTLSDIAQSFSVSLNRILDAEGRTLEGELIHPGERLLISVDTGLVGL